MFSITRRILLFFSSFLNLFCGNFQFALRVKVQSILRDNFFHDSSNWTVLKMIPQVGYVKYDTAEIKNVPEEGRSLYRVQKTCGRLFETD